MSKGEAHTLAGKAHQLKAARALAKKFNTGEYNSCLCSACKVLRQELRPRTFQERMARVKREKLARWKARGIEPVEGEIE